MNVALRPEHLNILSICTGGGGLDLGVELAIQNARTVCMVEREGFAVSTLVSAMEEGLLAQAPIWSNARTFDGRPWRGIVDGLIGGIPCQPHSLAGKRGGATDERDLWSDARRIIVQSGAWFVLIENVPGMLSAKEGLAPGALRVRRDLRKLGFSIEGGLFRACEVGTTHERERLFILAVADAICFGGPAGFPAEAGRDDLETEPTITFHDHNALADTSIARSRPVSIQPRRQNEASPDLNRPVNAVVDAIGRRRAGGAKVQKWGSKRRTADEWSGRPALFPPGPAEISQWQSVLAAAPELEPAFRRVADGMASRLDTGRVDRIRMLGNGVVPLQAAYAVRTLATRLAARGSRGAALLVRMMERIAA